RPAGPLGMQRLTSRRAPLPAADPALSRDGALARLEAVLLLADGSLSSRRLAELAGLADGTQARTLVRRLNELYDGRGQHAAQHTAQHDRAQNRHPQDGRAQDGDACGPSGEPTAFRVEEVAG